MGILESLLAELRTVSGSFPDARREAIDYPMADVIMTAFSLFFMQSESFLGYQRRLEVGQNDSNCRTLFGIAKIPTDNHIRTLPDGLAPDSLRLCFARRWRRWPKRTACVIFSGSAVGCWWLWTGPNTSCRRRSPAQAA